MQKFDSHKEWNTRLSYGLKVCHYQGFNSDLKSLNFRNKLKDFTASEVRDDIKKKIGDIKILLLYFDVIDIPFPNFVSPWNEFEQFYFNELFKNREFYFLIENRLVQAHTFSGLTVNEYLFEKFDSHKKNGLTKNFPKFFNSRLEAYLEPLRVYEIESNFRDKLDFQLSQLERFRNQNLKKIPTNTYTKLEKLIHKIYANQDGKTFKQGSFLFNLEKFRDDPIIRDYMVFSLFDGYQETGAFVPVITDGDVKDRKTRNGVFALLLNPLYFKAFLSNFFAENEIESLVNLDAQLLSEIRRSHYWSGYMEIYHELLLEVSTYLENYPTKEFEALFKNRAIKGIVSKGDRSSTMNILSTIPLFKFLRILDKVPSFQNLADLTIHKTLARLKNKKGDFYSFLVNLRRELLKTTR